MDGASSIAVFRSIRRSAGYHRITISGDERAGAMLALVPDTSYLPPTLAAGQRLWGLAAHLYTLRSDDDWGIGDFSDLARLLCVDRQSGRMRDCAQSVPRAFSRIVRRTRAPIRRPAGCFSIRSMSILRRTVHARAPRSTTFRVLQRFYVPANSSTTRATGAPSRQRSKCCSRISERSPNRPSLPNSSRNQGEALEHFALFSALAEQHGVPWQRWPLDLRRPDTRQAVSMRDEGARSAYHRYVQFLADRQLRKAADEASAAGMDVGLIRDLAMGINPDGADSWMDQEAYVPACAAARHPMISSPRGRSGVCCRSIRSAYAAISRRSRNCCVPTCAMPVG